MTLGLRQANQQFGKITKAVRAGETVVLTDRGKPFAQIRPLLDEIDVARAKMAADGFLIPAKKSGPWRRNGWKPIKLKGKKSSLDYLREFRDDRF